jgi:hypothetical protein
MDDGHGHMVTYSVYEGKTGADESTKKAAAWIKENIASLVPSPPQVIEGEVRLREIKERAKYGVVRRYQVDPKNVDKIVGSAKSGFLPPGHAPARVRELRDPRRREGDSRDHQRLHDFVRVRGVNEGRGRIRQGAPGRVGTECAGGHVGRGEAPRTSALRGPRATDASAQRRQGYRSPAN